MQLHASLRARNPQLAARTASWIDGAVGLLNLGVALAFPALPADERGWVLAAGLVFCAAAVVHRLVPADRLDRSGVLLGTNLVGVTASSLIQLPGGESSLVTPMMVLLSVLWTGVCLRTGAAWLVSVVGLVAFLACAVVLHTPADAAVFSVFLAAAVVLNTAVLSRALDQQAALAKKLTDIASLDALTGLATRRAFDEAVGIALTGHAEEKGTALVLVDLDRFKTINDVHGHPVGDRALQHVSAILSGSVRARDSVVGRLGGDELAVLLAGCPVDVAERRARDLWEAIRNTPLELVDGTSLQLTVSVGVAHAPPSGLCASELYAAADGALYAAKRGGRDTVAVAG